MAKAAASGSDSVKAGEAYLRATENDPESKAAWQRTSAHMRFFAKALKRLKDSPEFRAMEEEKRKRWQDFADAIRQANEDACDKLEARHFSRPKTLEDWEHLARIVEIPAETVQAGTLTYREIYACAMAWADRQTIKAELADNTKIGDGTGPGKVSEDNRDYVSAAKIRTDHAPAGVALDHRQLKRFLEQYPEIRTKRPLGRDGTPRGNRLLVHLGDWHKHHPVLSEWYDAILNPKLAPEDFASEAGIAERQAALLRRKQSPK